MSINYTEAVERKRRRRRGKKLKGYNTKSIIFFMEMPREVKREREWAFNSYKPCYFIEQVLKALSKCLGLERTEEGASSSSSSSSGGRDREVTSTASRGLKKPSRPPLSSGRGGQVN